MPALMELDHLVFATPDLDASIADLEQRLGVRAAYGGRHPGRGTRNALIALSQFTYLEIVGPDPAQRDFGGTRSFGIDALTAPRLATWAAKAANIEQVSREAARRGMTLGPVTAGSRQTLDGTALHWQYTDPRTIVEEGIVPFLIDWGDSPHPAASAPRGPVLSSLRAEHPDPERIERALSAVGVALAVERASQPGLIAALSTAHGEVELR